MVMLRTGKIQIQMHKRIIDALETHDLDKAREAILNEVISSQNAILDAVLADKVDTRNTTAP